jgi:SNF2 family DNA or RNA helicase
MNYTPHGYQQHATEHIINNDGCGLLMDMGLGKTVATLTAINQLMFDDLEVSKVLVIAPKRVAEHTWINEKDKWDHLKHLRLSTVLGDERQRKETLKAKADIYVINRENVAWLISFYGGAFPFDMVVIDELSSFKSPKSVRFKALRMIRPKVKRIVGLTGTPAPNGLLDLWSQIYLLDQGERLGKTFGGFKERYFTKDPHKPFAKYEMRKQTEDDLIGEDYYEKKIYEKIGDICISMKKEDWLDLPPRVDSTIEIILPKRIMQQYEDFECKQILAMEDTEDISVVNAAALSNKLLQFANGAVYDSEKNWHQVHGEKLEALEEAVEAANGQPVLVCYSYKHDVERIMRHMKAYKPEILKKASDVDRWNKKEIPLLLGHPASMGHGLNMQEGGHNLIWFGLPWGLEFYQQACARLDRQGLIEALLNQRLITKGTMDEDVLKALDSKAVGQEALMQAVKARVEKYTGKKQLLRA